jgi:hypothetical protein
MKDTKTDLESTYFWDTLDRWLDNSLKQHNNLDGNKQKKIKIQLMLLTEKLVNNHKFQKTIEDLRQKKEEIERIKQDIDKLTNVGVTMMIERGNLDNYINFDEINQLLASAGGEEVSANTLSNWNSKGFLGEAYTEKDICPTSFESHRTVYFEKEKVLDFLIKEKKVIPKYEILDQTEEGTVLKYVITKDNKLGYYCKNFETEAEAIIE